MLKVFIAFEAEVAKRAMTNMAEMVGEVVETIDEADIVIVDRKAELLRIYRKDKQFLCVEMGKQSTFGTVADNCTVTHVLMAVPNLLRLAGSLNKEVPVANPPKESPSISTPVTEKIPLPANHVRLGTRLRVLVVDDKEENRELAKALLGEDHSLVLCSGYGEAMKALEVEAFDAVLTDSQLPLDFYHGALGVTHINPGEQLQHQGEMIAYRATMRGAHAAVVTDASHHQDWKSAAYDYFREPMVLNGKRFMLINYLGKRWDQALATLWAK